MNGACCADVTAHRSVICSCLKFDRGTNSFFQKFRKRLNIGKQKCQKPLITEDILRSRIAPVFRAMFSEKIVKKYFFVFL